MYNYQEQKKNIFTEQEQVLFLKIRDNVHNLLAKSGAVTMGCAIRGCGGGDSWDMLACVDRLVELGEIREIPQNNVAGQNRIFVSTGEI
jgi:hypothetical protein